MAIPQSLLKTGMKAPIKLKKKYELMDKVPYKEFKKLIDKIQNALGITERQLIHRYISKATGITTRSILRYDKGQIPKVPTKVIGVTVELLRKIEDEETIVLYRGNDERPVVLRRDFIKLVDKVVELGLFPSKTKLLNEVEKRLNLNRGKLCRIYRNSGVQLVDKVYYDFLMELYQNCEYNPSKSYQVGDRIIHNLFGAGVVIEKLPKEKIVVEFKNGFKITLREQLIEDPYRLKLNSFIPSFNIY